MTFAAAPPAGPTRAKGAARVAPRNPKLHPKNQSRLPTFSAKATSKAAFFSALASVWFCATQSA